jgi:hypothetical protein
MTSTIPLNSTGHAFTFSELGWAMQHDWFCDGDLDSITVIDQTVSGVDFVEQVLTFTDINALKAWAGY